MKNKEIEELLNMLKKEDVYWSKNKHDYPFPDYYSLNREDLHLLLSYIEQLDTNYKEANESVMWWTNRYNAIVKQNDDNHKKVVKLENNRNKAVREIMYMIENGNIEFFKGKKLENILMGDNK